MGDVVIRGCLLLLMLASFYLEAAPRRIACTSESGEASAIYWSEQAKKNRAFGQSDKADILETNAAYCEGSSFGRKVVVTLDTEVLDGETEHNADFQLYTLCGREGGDRIAARISSDIDQFTVSYYHTYYRMMRYFYIDSATLNGGFVDQRDFQCRYESYDVSDKLM